MLGYRIERVRDGVRRAAEANCDALRLLERLVCQLLHFAREGGRKQHGLAPGRDGLDDAPHVGQEAHVEHAVSFVEDQNFDIG